MANSFMTGELAVVGDWIVACLEGDMAWPATTTKVSFRGQDLFLTPSSPKDYPTVSMNMRNAMTFIEGQKLIYHFLSSLAWVEGRGMMVKSWTGGNLPRPIGRGAAGQIVSRNFRADYLPDPTDQDARWALAFYREGLSLRHVAYKFLSFYKIINISQRTGSRQKTWINANIGNINGLRGKARRDELTKSGIDIGEYLFESNRCAIAHAGQDPTIDPDNPEHDRRLQADIPLVEALSAHAIETEFHVKSSGTVWRDHLYELEGFRALIGADVTEKLKRAESVSADELVAIPKLSIRLRDSQVFRGLESMDVHVAKIERGQVILECISADQLTTMLLCLNFPEERLQCDPEGALEVLDDGTEAAALTELEVMKFRLAYLLNGELEVFDAETGKLMGRCDPYFPLNVDLGASRNAFLRVISQIEQIARRRSGGSSPQGEP